MSLDVRIQWYFQAALEELERNGSDPELLESLPDMARRAGYPYWHDLSNARRDRTMRLLFKRLRKFKRWLQVNQ